MRASFDSDPGRASQSRVDHAPADTKKRPRDGKDVLEAVERAASGKDAEESFRLLFTRFYRLLCWHFIRRGASVDEVEDLAQETFVAVYRGLNGFRGASSFERWLLGVADNVYRNRRRRRRALKRAHQEVTLDKDDTPQRGSRDEGQPTPLDEILASERAREVEAAIREMPEQMRHCARLRYRQGLKYHEIAAALRISVDAVRVQLSRARRRLYDRFSGSSEGVA